MNRKWKKNFWKDSEQLGSETDICKHIHSCLPQPSCVRIRFLRPPNVVISAVHVPLDERKIELIIYNEK